MAFTTTTLASDLSATSNTMTVTSGTGFAVNQVVKIDGEYARIVAVDGAAISLALRGYDGTVASAHDVLSTVVTTSEPGDWTSTPMGTLTDRPPYVDDVISVGENGAIACPTRNTTITITKASALATSTLGDPPDDRDGLRLTIVSTTAAAHVITGVFSDGTTGAHTTLTYAADVGAGVILVARQGVWYTLAATNVTVG